VSGFDAFFACYLLFVLGLVCTKRVIVAWAVYFSLRREPLYRRPRAARWLWLKTLAMANGECEPGNCRRRKRRRQVA
jgi:hypothetical protein